MLSEIAIGSQLRQTQINAKSISYQLMEVACVRACVRGARAHLPIPIKAAEFEGRQRNLVMRSTLMPFMLASNEISGFQCRC